MCISIHQVTYIHSDKEPLFQEINLTVNKGQKIALVGNNGSGKSTLLRIIEGRIQPASGTVSYFSEPYCIPQHFGQYDDLTIAEALQVDIKINALHAIINGDASENNFTMLNDDWNIEERCLAALSFWESGYLQLSQKLNTLSGGEKTKVFLSGINIHSPEIILMDEPTNHLDLKSRNKLYDFVQGSRATLIIVSHDRTLLNLLPGTCELSKNSLTFYGGNYDFYKEQKEQELTALRNQLDEKEKELRLARKIARETMERKNKLDVRGEKVNLKKGISRMGMNTLQDRAEKSTMKLNDIHAGKMASITASIAEIQGSLPDMRCIKTDFNSPGLHTGKILVTANQINFGYNTDRLWTNPLNFQIRSGERIQITGNNGSGKTTLLKLITGKLKPVDGTIILADFSHIYVDQECSLIQKELTVFAQIEYFNTCHRSEHELKIILSRFLFPYGTWEKNCSILSGGEKMRLLFCCLMIGNSTPDLFILDEPTNNLDMQSVDIITAAIESYRGTVLLV